MSDTQITLEFLANTDGLKAAAQQMQLLGKVSKEQYAMFVKANRDAQQVIAAMAKEQATTGKVFNDTAKQAGELNLQYRHMGQFIATGAVNELTKHFVGLASQIVANNEKLTELNAQLSQLQQTINSGQLQGEALVKAKDNAADLLEQVKDATEAAEKLGAAFKSEHLQFYGNSLNMVVSGLAAAQSGAALFGVENKKLEETLLKAQAATALVTSAQQGFGAALKVVSYLEQQFAATSATAWAAATGGISVLVTAVAGLVAYLSSANDEVADIYDNSAKTMANPKNADDDWLKEKEEHMQKLDAKDAAFFQNQKERMIAARLQDEDMQKVKLVLLKEQIAEYTGLYNWYQVSADAEGVSGEERKKREATIMKYIREAKLEEKELSDQIRSSELAAAKESSRKQIELTIRTLELQRAKTIAGSEEDIALFKKVQAQKLELAKLNGAGEIEQGIIKQEQENALQQYIGAQLKAKQDLHQQGMEQLRQNAAEEAAFIAEFEAHKLEIQQAYENMSIEEFRKWVEEKRAIYTQQALDEQRNQKALDELKLNHDLQLKLQQDFGLTQQQIDDDYAASGFATFKEYEQKKRAELQNTADKMAENQKLLEQAESAMQQFMFDSIQQLSDAAFDNMKQARDQQLNTTLESMEKQKQLELSNKNLTEQQKKDIEDKYRRMEAEAKKKAWKADQQAKAEQALINGFLAFTMSLAQQGVPAGLITGAIALATAGVQAGIILSKPVPQFAGGGKNIPAGMKLVGEQGPELIWTPGGETVIPHGDTAKILEAWSIPVPNVNPALKTDMAIAAALPAGIDYNKLAQAFARELRNNPSVNISMDNAGFALHLLQKNKSVHLLNNRYSA